MSTFFTSPLFYGIYISIMISLFFYFLFNNLLPYYRARKEVNILTDFIFSLEKDYTILQKAEALNQWLNQPEHSNFIKQFVKPSFSTFNHKLSENHKRGIMLVPDIYDYFLEDNLMQKIGKRKLVDTIPGLFLAMGIIGTFLGIAVGVSQLDPGGDAESMKNGIGVLLNGMQVKFTSSIVGIFLSVIWQFLDKMAFYPMLSDSYYKLRQHLDELFPTQEQNTVLYQMLTNQVKQMDNFQGFITEKMIPQMITGINNVVDHKISPQILHSQTLINRLIDSSEGTRDYLGSSLIPNMVAEVQKSLQDIITPEMRKNQLLIKELIDSHKETKEYLTQSILPNIMTGMISVLNETIIPQLETSQSLVNNLNENTKETKEFFAQSLVPKMVSGMTDAFNQTISPQLQQSQKMMEEMIKNTRETQMEGIGIMVDRFVDSLTEITGNHMKDLGEALKTTIQWQEKVQDGMSTLVESMENSANKQTVMAESTTSLAAEIHKYTEKIVSYETVMETNISVLNEMLEKSTNVHMNISELLEIMVKERETFSEISKNQSNVMDKQVKTFIEQTNKQFDVNSKMEINLEKINKLFVSQQDLSDDFLNYLSLSNKANKDLTSIVENMKQNGVTQVSIQKELNATMSLLMKEKNNVGNMVTSINSQLVAQLSEMDQRIKRLTEVWQTTSATFTTANKHLATSMNQFTADMHQGLEYTFKQFDDELSKSVSYLSKAVHAIHDGIVDLPDSIQVLNTSVVELNKHAKSMVKMI
ncbi:hypothetical protein AABM38_11210 [Heyndrickxia sp. MSNUG]|uniref:hypothetical protein n=1 Tax=Heyndrickxia sp. MSNUG TaxID=3136677 RepID=UPI003C2D94E1